MRIIISPAKKMNADTDTLPYRDLPAFLPDTQQLLDRLRGMDEEGLKKLWKCNDQIAALNVERLAGMDLRRNLTPAIIAYEGIQYQYIGCIHAEGIRLCAGAPAYSVRLLWRAAPAGRRDSVSP